MRKWKIDLIHHSHTDLGYTDRQENICLQHEGFLRQALDILRRVDRGELPGCEGFRWQCENFWQIENLRPSPEEAEALRRYAREGRIGLSGNYLNLTELVDRPVLLHALQRAARWGETAGRPVRSAMSADINGYAWGMPDVMAEAGMENLLCALHTHHGMFPLGYCPSLFWWEGPEGGRVLTYVSDHYHFGNVLGFCPGGNSSAFVHDAFHTGMENGTLLSASAAVSERQELTLARERITHYLDDLERTGYPLDCVGVEVSGIISDNGPPNARIAERVGKLNALLAPRVEIRMCVLDDLFEDLRAAAGEDIPVYRGDFTDWWADGVGSTPGPVSLFREAQRSSRLCRKLDPAGTRTDRSALSEAERSMMLYSEHTWSYSSSVFRPWEPLVNAVSAQKTAYAAAADTAAQRALNSVLLSMGMKSLSAEGTQRWRVLNPHPFRAALPVEITLANWEYMDGCLPDRRRPFALRDLETGELLPCQNRSGSRGLIIETVLELDAGAHRDLEICYGPDQPRWLEHIPRVGADGVTDIDGAPDSVLPNLIRTDRFIARLSRENGLYSLLDRTDGRELLASVPVCGAFGAAYDVTPPADASQTVTRRRMGRKRFSVNSRRSFSRVKSISVEEDGSVYTVLKLSWELEGCSFIETRLKLYRHAPLMRADIRLHKQSVHSAESLYVSLPFAAEGDTWIDKTACVLRPGLDQLPSTCGEFWLLQNGLSRRLGDRDILIAAKDTPLVVFGLPDASPVVLCDGHDAALNRRAPWSWVMNNFWETNFNADLSGFYEFRYTVALDPHASPAASLSRVAALNEGFAVMRI